MKVYNNNNLPLFLFEAVILLMLVQLQFQINKNNLFDSCKNIKWKIINTGTWMSCTISYTIRYGKYINYFPKIINNMDYLLLKFQYT